MKGAYCLSHVGYIFYTPEDESIELNNLEHFWLSQGRMTHEEILSVQPNGRLFLFLVVACPFFDVFCDFTNGIHFSCLFFSVVCAVGAKFRFVLLTINTTFDTLEKLHRLYAFAGQRYIQ